MAKTGDITAAEFESFLRRKLGHDDLQITSIEKFTRGISRETWSMSWKCATQVATAANNGLIVRRDLARRAIVPTTLQFEYEMYRKLAGTAVPVPDALFMETAADAPGGRPFYVRRQVEGSWKVENFDSPDPAYVDLKVAVVKEHLRKLALVHQVDWRAHGFDTILAAPADAADCAQCAIDRNIADLRSRQIEPLPILTEAREWLLDNAPDAPIVALLKGTNGIGEEVFVDGAIVAMCDWEQASLGDPACDLARSQDIFIDITDASGARVWGFDEALAYYNSVSGISVTRSAIEYYRTLVALENSVALHNGAVALCHDGERDLRLAWLATEISFYGNRQILDTIHDVSTNATDTFLNTKN